MTNEEIDAYYTRERMNDPYAERHYYESQRKIEGIPLNPVQRYYFDMTPNEERDQREVDDWWDQPYIVTEVFEKDIYKDYLVRTKDNLKIETEDEFNKRQKISATEWEKAFPGGIRYDVRCLDGGAWDRSTWKGSFDNINDALELAKSLKDIS